MPDEDMRIRISATDDLSRPVLEGKSTVKKLGDEADRTGKKIKGLGDDVDRTGDKTKKSSRDWQKWKDSLNNAAQSVNKTLGRAAKGGMTAALTGVGLSGGMAIGAALSGGITKTLDLGASRARLSAQLGLTARQADQAGKLAGKLYASGYGDSLASVNQAVRTVASNITGTGKIGSRAFEELTRGALTLSDVFGQDLNQVTGAVASMLRNGLARDGRQALDILTAGFQKGADKREDFLDTIVEYGVQFRKLGLDGTRATAMLSQGLQAGARDADTVADALKEFSIRAIDGSTATAAGYKLMGLNGERMAQRIAKGGDSARGGLDLILNRLRGMEDPVKRSQAAVALFGTKAEDLGASLYALDPSGQAAVATLGKVQGAAQKAGDTAADSSAAKIDKLKRSLEQLVTGAALPAVEDPLAFLSKHADEVKVALQVALPVVLAFKAAALGLTAIQAVSGVVTGFRAAVAGVALAENASTAAIIGNKVATLGAAAASGVAKAATLAWTGVQWLLNAALTANPIGLVVAAVALLIGAAVLAYKKVGWFRDAVDATWRVLKGGAQAAVPFVIGLIQKLVNFWLWQAEMIIQGAAKAFGWVPGIGPKLKGAAEAFGRFRANVNSQLDKLKDKTVTVKGKAVLTGDNAPSRLRSMAPGVNDWGGTKRAGGGMIHGPGTGTSDSIPARLSNGEFVMNARATRNLGPSNLYAMQAAASRGAAASLAGFASGGMVTAKQGVIPRVTGDTRQFGEGIGRVSRALDAHATMLAREDLKRKQAANATGGRFAGSGVINYLVQFIRSMVPGASVSSTFRPGAVTRGTGRRSLHAIGRAVDFTGPLMDIWRAGTRIPHMKELIYSPAPYQVYRSGVHAGPPSNAKTRADHYNHVHVGLYDQGGYLEPGWNLAYNGTGAPEPVGPGGGGVYIAPGAVQVHNPASGIDIERAVAAGIKRHLAEKRERA